MDNTYMFMFVIGSVQHSYVSSPPRPHTVRHTSKVAIVPGLMASSSSAWWCRNRQV
jgi:hypothetical protein